MSCPVPFGAPPWAAAPCVLALLIPSPSAAGDVSAPNPPPAESAAADSNTTQPPIEQPQQATITTSDPAILLRLERLEEELRAIQKQTKTTRPSPADFLPDLAFIADVALAAFSTEETLQLGAHDATTTGFHLQHLELSFGKAVDPFFRLDGNLAFSAEGVEVEEVYATTIALPGRMQVRAGQFLTRFGRVNGTHPHLWSFLDQPLLLGRLFGGEGNRGPGVEWSVLPPLPWSLEFVVSATDAAGEGEARSFYGDQDLGIRHPLDLQWTFALKQFFALPAAHDVALGFSFAGGPNGTGRDQDTQLAGVDLRLKRRLLGPGKRGQFSITTEWAFRRMARSSHAVWDLTGFAEAELRPIARFGLAARYEYGTPTRNFEGAQVADPVDPSWTTARHRGAVALTLWPTEFSRIRLQGTVDAPLFVEAPIYGVVLGAEFLIGTHAAHTW